MKRQAFIKHCLVVLVFVMFLNVGTDVQAKDRKGSCGDDASWVLHDDGTLEITGTGLMYAEPACNYKDRIKNVIIHEGITSLDEEAFIRYGTMESIQLPESLKEVGLSAFWNCCELKEIRIPDGVNKIPSYTFSFCSSLEKVILPQGLKTIPAYMFEECTNLKEVNIPDSVTEIGTCAFYQCNNLSIEELPDTVVSIGAGAFGDCKSITSFRISANVSTIKSSIFDGCDSLTRLEVSPDNPVYDSRDNCNAIIKSSTHALVSACSVTHIPESVTSIGSRAFSSFENLYAIELPENIQKIDRYAFAHCINLENIVIPDKVTSLGEYAFYNCAKLTNAVLPDGLTQIKIGAFEECSSLESIVIPNSVETLGNAVFRDCTSLTEVTLSDSITKIPECAFYGCSLLPTVKIPSGVKKIGCCAFFECSSLESIAIPAAVTNIAYSAFYDCGSLGKISVSSKNEYYDSRNKCNAIIRKKDNKLLFGCNNTVIPSSVKSIGEYAFYGCSSLGKIKIPASVTKIGEAAFTNSFSSVTVDGANPVFDSRGNCNAIIKTNNNELLFGCNQTVIPAGIRRIGFRAFESCNDLVSLVIPDGVESIGCGAFDKCSNLTEITIPKSVTEIEIDIFTDCDNLSDIYFKGSKKAWDHIDPYDELLSGNDHVKVHTLLAQKISAGNVSKSYSSSARKIAINASNRAGLPMTYKCSTSKLSVSSDGMLTIPGGYSGKAYVTIKTVETDAYESASKKISVTVRPPKTSIKSASNVSGAKISLSWYKKSSVTGYQIEYGTSSSFSGTTHKKTITSNATTSSKISHLTTGKNYYVRIRTYKTVKDSRIYSLWSNARKVKVTK